MQGFAEAHREKAARDIAGSGQHTVLAPIAVLCESEQFLELWAGSDVERCEGAKERQVSACVSLLQSEMTYYPNVPLITPTDPRAEGDRAHTGPGHREASVPPSEDDESSLRDEESRKTRGTPEKDGDPGTSIELVACVGAGHCIHPALKHVSSKLSEKKNRPVQAGEVVQRLRALGLAEDPGDSRHLHGGS